MPSTATIHPLENDLLSLPYLLKHRSSPDAHEWYETRPYAHIPDEKRKHSLTGHALRGDGKLAHTPLIRSRKDETESLVIVHVGSGLCGWEGIVHGGLLATLLDEAMGRQAAVNFTGNIATTANLTLDYKAPTRADQFIVIRTSLVEVNGRKATIEGAIEDLEGTLLVKAKALFVQPKWASQLDGSVVQEAIKASRPDQAASNGASSEAPVDHP